MLRLQDVFKKTAKHLNSPPAITHCLFHIMHLFISSGWKKTDQSGKNSKKWHFAIMANWPSQILHLVHPWRFQFVRPENVWTNISCQICNCRIGITESPNPHGILRKRPKAARKSLGNGASITISCWLKSVDDDHHQQQQQQGVNDYNDDDDDHHYHNNIIVIINFKKLRKYDNTIGKGNKS